MNISMRADGLTPENFEKFAIELVQRKFSNSRIHGFDEGTDQGIDGIDDIIQPTIVVQAKRWKLQTTGTSKIKEEIDKIAAAKMANGWTTPFKYIFVTSRQLSPKNLKEIREYAENKIPGSMLSDDFILYAKTLEELSGQKSYRPIFQKYNLLDRDFLATFREESIAAIEDESKGWLNEIDFQYIVETAFLGAAYDTLLENNIVLLTGSAGIGKTTTSQLLGWILINNETERSVSLIKRSIDKVDNVIDLYNRSYKDEADKVLVVVFDDFLGRNYYDKDNRSLEAVRRLYYTAEYSTEQNLFIILNSRTEILNSALRNEDFSFFLDEKRWSSSKFLIELSRYSDVDKAGILRKTFEKEFAMSADENKEYIQKKYDDFRQSNYLNIVRHANYAPRLIQLAVKEGFKASEGFYDFLISNLDDPFRLYREIFGSFSEDKKYLLMSLLMFDKKPVLYKDLIRSVTGIPQVTDSFDAGIALEELDGSWVRIVVDGLTEIKKKVDFFNPSIIDFLQADRPNYNTMRDKLKENSKFLAQMTQIVPGLFSKRTIMFDQSLLKSNVLTKWASYEDKANFIGERIVALIKNKTSNFEDRDSELLQLLDLYTGGWHPAYSSGWDEVINQIYFTQDLFIKIAFLVKLNETDFVDRILRESVLGLEELQSITSSIRQITFEVSSGDILLEMPENLELVERIRKHGVLQMRSEFAGLKWLQQLEGEYVELADVFDISDLNFEELPYYDRFRAKGMELIQRKLDDSTIAYDYSELFESGLDEDAIIERIFEKIKEDQEQNDLLDSLQLSDFDTANIEYWVQDFFEEEQSESEGQGYLKIKNESQQTALLSVSDIIDREL